MTKKLYYGVSDIKEFEGNVLSCEQVKDGYLIILDQTAFYPEGGGQPADTGTLNGIHVLDVHEKDGEICHYTDKPLAPGETVYGVLDWEKRYSNMQHHTGEHIVSGLIHKEYGFDNVGFHMGHDVVTLDMNGELSEKDIIRIEEMANRKIYEDTPIHISYPSEKELAALEYRSKKELSGEVRIVTVPEADICACCGTHVKTTGEIGIIKLVNAMKYKGGTRISMLCGLRALRDYQQKQVSVLKISNTLSAKAEVVCDAVDRLKKDNIEKDFQIGNLYKQLFEFRALAYPQGTEKLILFEDDLMPLQLRTFATILAAKVELVLVCSGDEENGYKYAAASANQDMRIFGKELNQFLNGKGGGSAEMVQGTLYENPVKIEEFFNKKN